MRRWSIRSAAALIDVSRVTEMTPVVITSAAFIEISTPGIVSRGDRVGLAPQT
jgi:hypothetical protein